MLVFRMFATLHVQTAFPPPCLCDLGDLCVEIPSPFLTQCYSSSRTSKQAAQNKSLQITALRALSFSVSRKSFTCHSLVPSADDGYENNWGAYQLFPIWNLQLKTSGYLFSFHILPHSFALFKISTLLFSSNSELFHKNTQVGGGVRILHYQLAFLHSIR